MIKKSALPLVLFGLLSLQIFAQQTELFRSPLQTYNLGLEYFDKELYSAAQKEFEKAAKFAATENEELSVNSEYYSALCALKLFHRDASLRLRDFIRRHPESSKIRDAHFQLGGYYYRKRDWDKVISWYGKVDPYDLGKEEKHEYKFKLGYAYLKKEDLEKASRNFYEIKDVNNAYASPARYYFAHISYLNNNYQTALTDFKKLSSHEKFGPLVPYYVSQILFNQKKYDELLDYAPPLLDSVISKRKPEMSRLIGEAHYHQRDYESALPFLEAYKKESRALNNDDRYQLAYTYYKLEEYQKAIPLFSRLTGLDNEMAQTASYHLGDCYVKSDQKNHARSAFKNAYELGFDKKISEESLFNFARLSYELALDPYKSSVEAFQKFIDEYPESSKLDDAYNYLIAVYLTTKNYDAALASIEKVKTKTPQLKAAYQKISFNKGISEYQNRSYQSAIKFFDQSHQYKSSEKLTALAFYWKAEANYRLKQYDAAVKDYTAFMYESGAILTPVFNEANYNIAYCHFKSKDYNTANVWFRKYVYNQNPDTFKLNDALLRIADGYFMLKDYSQAIDFYGKANKIGAADADYALYQKAVCYGIEKELDLKISSLETLIAENPGSSYLDASYYELGRSYNKQNQSEKAIESYGQVIAQGNQNVYLKKSLIQTGLIHYKQNEYDKSIAVFTKVVSDYPTYQDTKEALNVLKDIYIERGEASKYADLVATLDFVDITKEELDSAVFMAAQDIYQQGDCQAAKLPLQRYLRDYPKGYRVLEANYYLASCYAKASVEDSAIMHYEIIANMPTNSYSEMASKEVANHAFRNEMYSKAYQYFTKLEMEATSARSLRHASGGKLEAAFNLDSTDVLLPAAETYLGHGFADAPYYAMAHLIKARNYVKQQDFSRAMEEYQIVTDTNNTEYAAEAKYGIAKISYSLDSLDTCEALVFELVNQVPSYGYWVAKSLILLSDVYVKKDDNFQAKAVLNTILENYDGDDLKQVAQSKLDAIKASENKEDEEQPEAPDMEIEFEEGDLDTDEIEALFEELDELEDEEEIFEEEIESENINEEGNSDEK